VKDLDAGIAHNGRSLDLSSDEPLFVTDELKWWKQKYILPPSFEVFPGKAHEHGSWKRTDEQRGTQPCETTGPLSSPPHGRITFNSVPSRGQHKGREQRPYPLAKIKYNGWEGLTHMSVSLTLYNITPDMHYHNSYSHNLADTVQSTPDDRSQYSILRMGWKREYVLDPGGHKWRSPSVLEKNSLMSKSALDDTIPIVHGNLILEDSEANLVAVYKQRRDWEILGNLTVFSKHAQTSTHETTNEQLGRMTVEAVVASCLAVVVYERVGWQNLWGN